jgi:hypothetical protein
MTVLSASQMREVDGEGLWDGFICGASVGALIAVALSPDPISKFTLGAYWTSAISSCGRAFL